jgi:hypothetical protein
MSDTHVNEAPAIDLRMTDLRTIDVQHEPRVGTSAARPMSIA